MGVRRTLARKHARNHLFFSASVTPSSLSLFRSASLIPTSFCMHNNVAFCGEQAANSDGSVRF